MIAGIVALAVLIFASFYLTSGNSKLNVETDRITISEIKEGPFKEFIPVNGVVLPVSTIFLDAIEGGKVEEKFVEDGAIMKAGQPILRMSNTDLELQLANQETQVFNVLTQMQISKNNSDQNSINRISEIWATTRHPDLARLVVAQGWVANRPVLVKILGDGKVVQSFQSNA